MTNSNSPELYWQEGEFQRRIQCPRSISHDAADKALGMIGEFFSNCEKQSIIVAIAAFGKHWSLKMLKNSKDNNRTFFGTAPPDAPQSLGKSTISSILDKDLREMLKAEGEFENQLSKQFIVFVYHLWDDNFRYKIADSLSISKNQVECDLMGDIRRIRNSIIHENSDIRQEDLNHLKILSQIWDLKLGELVISWKMIHSLMEQINALYVKIKPEKI